jgi:hypothetical protein
MKNRMMKKVLIALTAGVVVAVVAVATVIPAMAVSGNVTVSGTNNAKITISVEDTSAAFGTNLDPSGPDSNSSDSVVDFQGTTGNQGSYYVWKAGGSGNTITVKSNKSWNGTVAASENTGTSTSMTVASGAMRYAEAVVPTSYSDAAGGVAFQTTGQAWKSSVAKGVNSYTHFYSLRVDWNDDPGTFASTITYEVTQVP